jgi:hypothetical protein
MVHSAVASFKKGEGLRERKGGREGGRREGKE